MSDSSPGPSCYQCGKPLELPQGNVGREEMCLKCNADVRVCLNCQHYDPGTYNECGEPMAERVVEKNRRNFCDYFRLSGTERQKTGESKEDIFKKLDDLFKK